MASVKKIIGKNGTSYRIRVFLEEDENGKTIVRSHNWRVPQGISKREEKKQLDDEVRNFESKIKMGINTKKITFRQLSDMYLKDAEKYQKPSSISSTRDRLKYAYPIIGHIPVDSLKKQDMRNYVSYLEKPKERKNKNGKTSEYTLSPTTIRDYVKSVSQVLSYGCELDILPFNILEGKGVKMPSLKKQKPKLLEQSEMEKILTAIEKYAPLQYKTYFYLLSVTACRRGELLGLSWENVDFENNVITINETSSYIPGKGIIFTAPKTESSVRQISVAPSIMKLLKKWEIKQKELKLKAGELWQRNPKNTSEIYCENHNKCKKQCTGYCEKRCKSYKESQRVFTRSTGEPMHSQRPLKWLQTFTQDHDLPKATVHIFRHTAISRLLLEGTAVTTVQGFAGHSSPRITMEVYAHCFQEEKKTCSKDLANAFKLSGIK